MTACRSSLVPASRHGAVVDLAAGSGLAPIVVASALVYLGAAALGRRDAARPLFFGTFVVIAAARLAGADPTWLLLGVAAATTIGGLVRAGTRPVAGFPLQVLAMAGFGAMAAAAVVVGGPVGGYLVAAGLLGHAAWDVHHHRREVVVSRSLAEFCFVLDTLLAVAVVVVTALG